MNNNGPCKGILQRIFSAFGSKSQPKQEVLEIRSRVMDGQPAWLEIRDLNRVSQESSNHLQQQRKRV